MPLYVCVFSLHSCSFTFVCVTHQIPVGHDFFFLMKNKSENEFCLGNGILLCILRPYILFLFSLYET